VTGSVHVVIVNFNAGPYLRGALGSIARASAASGGVERVTVVDNASSDGSATDLGDLAEALPLEVIRNPANVGFAAACNQGAAGTESDYVLFLNPDARLVEDTLAVVTGFMDSARAAEVGICGVQVLDESGAPSISCARFPTLRVLFGKMTRLDRIAPRLFPSHHLRPAETERSGFVDQVIGAFFFVRRELFDRLQGFDTRYFIYYEEVDFALRARELGYRSYFLHEARIEHAGSVSASQAKDLRLYHSLRSRLLYARRHWTRAQAATIAVLTFGFELPARLAMAALRRDRDEVASTLGAYRILVTGSRDRGRVPAAQ
jgi:N-acetylglucosaminyl-diphospho-decaprenol L-rhamnosyltransferase